MYEIMYTDDRSHTITTVDTLDLALDAVSARHGGQRVDYDDRSSSCGSVLEYHVRLVADGQLAEPVAIITDPADRQTPRTAGITIDTPRGKLHV